MNAPLLAEVWLDSGDVLVLALVAMAFAAAGRLVLQRLAAFEQAAVERRRRDSEALAALEGRIERLERRRSAASEPPTPPEQPLDPGGAFSPDGDA
jgi:hypothetical protein